MAKKIYTFGDGKAEGTAEMRNLLGGKGANLAEMNLLGMPVPPGFTITTEVCTEYTQLGRDAVVADIKSDVEKAINHIETLTGKKFDDPSNPLLVSVRSGARASMPGMMDTVLNLGMNNATVETMAEKSGNPRFAWDSYRYRSLRGHHGPGEGRERREIRQRARSRRPQGAREAFQGSR